MKGIVLGGGLGTRLYPMTHATNKHLLPIFDQPMIYYPLKTLLEAGIKDIFLVTGGPHAGDYLRVLKNGKELGINTLHYAYQDRPDGGIADALSLAEEFAGDDDVCVILGDNTTDASIKDAVSTFKTGAKVFLKKVSDPQRFGVATFSNTDSNKIVEIEEKPSNPKSNYAVTGLYIYDKNCFKYIKTLTPSARGQLEITDLNNIYIKNNEFYWEELNGFWSDAGTPESLYLSNKYWASKKGF